MFATTGADWSQKDGQGRSTGHREDSIISAPFTWVRLNAKRGSEQYQATITNRVIVRPLAAGGRQVAEHRRLGVFRVGKGQHSLW